MHIALYYFLISFSYFHLVFLTLLAARQILEFTMSHSISLQTARNIMEIKKYFIVHDERKGVTLIITKTNIYIRIFGIKYELFLLPYQMTFFSAFGQAKILFNYHILMNMVIYIGIIL